MKHNLLKSVIISVILLMGVSNAWGATNTTVYYAVPTSVVGSYTVKCNVNYKGDGEDWQQHNMTKTDKTYDGYPIYSCTFTDKYDGLDCLQFQLYDGNTHKGQQQPIGSWTTASTYNGKLLKHNQAGWNTYRYDQHGFEAANNGIKYYSNLNANDEEWNFNGQSAQTKELGEVTSLYLKEWFVQLYENWTGAQGNIKFQYNIHPTANSAGNYTEITKTWEVPGNWNNGWLYPKYGNNAQNINLLNGLPGSGKYTMSFKYYDSDLKLTSPVHKLNWTYNIVPAVNNFQVTASNVVSGTGTSGAPYVIACGKTTTLTVSGSKASTDANSSLYAKFGDNTYSSTLTKDLTPKSTTQSIQVKAKYYNSKDNLSGTETTTQTIYYRAQTFAVNITSSGNGTVTPSGTQQVGATTVSITATPNLGYAFKQWEVTDGAKVANATSATTTITATSAGTVKAVFEEKPATTIYLEPTGHWNSHNPQYVAHVWNTSGHDDIIMKGVGDSPYRYYKAEVPYGYTNVVFYRKSTEGTTIWNQTADLSLPTNDNVLYTITSTGTNNSGQQDYQAAGGNWKVANLVYTVTLAGTSYGSYDVTYNSNTYSVSSDDMTINDVPLNSQLTITNIQPNAGYDQTMVYSTDGANYTEFGPEKTLTVTANTIISEDFRTTEEHDIYLKITANSDTYWINGNNEALPRILFVHGTNGEDQYTYPLGNLEDKIKSFEKVAQNDDFKIYKITAPIGYHSFFLYPPHTYDASAPFNHKIILEDQNCYELTDNETVGNGQWIDPRFTVTLRPTAIGQFTFEYNGQRYTNHVDKNVVFDVLPGETIILVESGHYNSNVYNGDLNKNGQLLNFPEDKIHVINENTEFKEDFVVKKGFAPITVYLRIPKVLDDEGTGHWQSGKERDIDDNDGDGDSDFMDFANFVWLDGVGAHEQVIAQSTFDNAPDRVEPRHFRMQPVDVNDETYNIYTCTILDSCFYGLKFEYKHIDGDHGRGGIHQTQSQNLVNFDQTNCFTITGKNGNDFTGYWDKYTEVGDYRMLYVEQEVAKGTGEDNWKTVINRTKCHPSDIIKKGAVGQKDTVSLHINTAGNNPEVILQQYQTVDGVSKWVDIEAHMVNGPLKADAGMAMINGRRNAGANSDIDDFVYDDGIEVIKNDDKYQENSNDQGVSYKGSGVWNFIITQSEDTAVLDMTNIHRYNGKYYIRVEYKERYWETYRISSQEMTYSSYSEQNSRFSHYFCEWLKANGQRNVKFVVANEYSSAISDTLIADRTDLWGKTLEAEQIMVSEDGILPENANVRFSWEDMTNKLHRAYLRGATHTEDRFLVVRGSGDGKLKDIDGDDLTAGAQYSDRYGLQANEEIFKDNNNWIYYTDVQMKPSAQVKIIAEYDEIDQYFIGSSDTWSTTVLQGTADNAYPIRLLYDFKINRLISAYVPRGNTIDTEIESIATNLMLIRRNNGEATQLAFANNNMSDVGQQAYGVLELTEDSLHDSSQPLLKRSLYWISFPFDVYLPDAISSGKYGVHWLIQSYNGARRAEEGLWLESEPFWDFHWDNDITLEAGKGYVLEIDIAQLDADGLLPDNGTIGFYFPSKQAIQNHIVQYPNPVTVEVDPHECTINRPIPGYGDRTIRDSHWNVIGVPSYVNAGADFSEHVENKIDGYALKFYYRWDGEQDKYTAIQSKNDKTQESNFHTLHAYMVQFAGDLQWNSVVAEGQGQPEAIAARRMSDYRAEEYNLTLELQQNGSLLDHTYVTLQEEDVTAAFDFNYDLCKIRNAGANVYSLIATETGNVEVAGNVLPVESAVVPLGVVAATAGEYTFAMPDGTDGIIVELIDYETNTRTNLLLSDYTVNLPAGTNDTRFALHVQPSKVTTSIENGAVEGESGKVRKLVIDGKLLLQKGNTLYDAQGHIVR